MTRPKAVAGLLSFVALAVAMAGCTAERPVVTLLKRVLRPHARVLSGFQCELRQVLEGQDGHGCGHQAIARRIGQAGARGN